MSIRQSNLRGFIATYHRNGVAGNGFHACSFTWRDGNNWIDMKAIVFSGRGNVAVITDNLTQRWRGDDFEPVLREAIKLQDKAQPMRAYTYSATA